MNRSRRSPLLWLFSAILAIAFVAALLVPATVTAQAADSSTAAVAASDASAALSAIVAPLVAKWPWVSTVLLVFGGFSVLWNAVIAYLHQRAAATSNLDDDNWLASLESKWWFRFFDRIAYFGGYAGSWLGGKKL